MDWFNHCLLFLVLLLAYEIKQELCSFLKSFLLLGARFFDKYLKLDKSILK